MLPLWGEWAFGDIDAVEEILAALGSVKATFFLMGADMQEIVYVTWTEVPDDYDGTADREGGAGDRTGPS